MGTGSSRATFVAYSFGSDGGTGSEVGKFEVQYNPKEVKSDKASTWKKKDKQGSDGAALEYQQGEPRTLTMDLFFDTTTDGNESVHDKWIKGLLALTDPGQSKSDGGEKKFPPLIEFTWASFKFTGIIEKVSTAYLMFNYGGDPIRAKVTVAMKEYKLEEFKDIAGGKIVEAGFTELAAGSNATVVEAGAGDTANTLASDHGTTYQDICQANGIDDPVADLAGKQILIP